MYNSRVIHSFKHNVIFDSTLAGLQQFISEMPECDRFIIICDTNTAVFCLPLLLERVKFAKEPLVIVTEAGEKAKTLTSCIQIWQQFTQNEIPRNAVCINLGGGMVTDIGGFAASLYKRGIRFINVPTSLLAMVDASVGGKNGVDFSGIKNQIGLFSFPLSVFSAAVFLKTLPKRELLSGFAEMIKHGLLEGGLHWKKICTTIPDTIPDNPELIIESVKVKNGFVISDPFDQNGRKALNFGHTVGHALEAFLLNAGPAETILHGEAIAVGMIAETYLSELLCGLSHETGKFIRDFILKWFKIPDFDVESVYKLSFHDKKNRNGVINCSLLIEPGSIRNDINISGEQYVDALKFTRSQNNI
jgi:3-dehydroquinate synthase